MKRPNSWFENILKLQGSYINGYCQEQSCSWKFFLLLQAATDVAAVTLGTSKEGVLCTNNKQEGSIKGREREREVEPINSSMTNSTNL